LAQRAVFSVFRGSNRERAELDLSASDGWGLAVFEVRNDLGNIVVGNGLASGGEAGGEISAEFVEVSDDFGFGGVVGELTFDPGNDEFASIASNAGGLSLGNISEGQ